MIIRFFFYKNVYKNSFVYIITEKTILLNHKFIHKLLINSIYNLTLKDKIFDNENNYIDNTVELFPMKYYNFITLVFLFTFNTILLILKTIKYFTIKKLNLIINNKKK